MKRRMGERGQVLPLVALCLAVLMGFAGMAVDVGYLEYQQRQQQNATDAAAVGGAQQFEYSGCGTSAAYTAAQTDAANNGYTNGSGNVTVTAASPAPPSPYAGNNCAIQVTITSPHATFFTKLFGHSNMPETTQAVATIEGANPCIVMLDQNQNDNFNGSTITAPQCDLQLNGTANFHSATVQAAAILEGDYAGSNNGGTFTGASPVESLPIPDPCPQVAGCAYLTNNPPATSPCLGTYSGSPLAAGCYANLNLHGQTVTLSGGLYVFPGGSNFQGATFTGTGVTIYIPAGATTNFNNANFVLTPPTSGNYADVTYYQVASNTETLNFNGSNTNLQGMIYAPGAQVNYNGSLGQYVLLVAGYGNFNSSNGLDFGAPGSGIPYILHQAVLVQ